MSDFREKLVALGKGDASLDEVFESLDQLIAVTPHEVASAKELVESAQSGGLSETIRQTILARIDAALANPLKDEATVVSTSGEEKTVMAGSQDDITVAMSDDSTQNAGSQEDVTTVSEGNEDPTEISGSHEDATVAMDDDSTLLAGSQEDVTAVSEGNEDPTEVSGATAADHDDEQATMFKAAAAEEATRFNARSATTRLSPTASDARDDDATAFNEAAGDDATMVSPREIDDAFDILSPHSMRSAERSLGDTSGVDYPTDLSTTQSLATDNGEVVFEEGSLLRNRFILEKKLGEGGMGAVWKGVDKLKEEARDRNPYVAIKLLQGDFRDHPEAFIALQRETAKQQRLAHPNIATVFDFDRDDNTSTVFMTMEVLDGDDLAAFIRRKMPADGLAYEDAMDIIEQLGQGLAYAHQAGLVHSDLKPGNCFLTDDNTVKLLDFGIARASATKADVEGETTVFDPGELGALTPAYATIEMFEGVEPDPRDDIYAMAIIAYQLFTGHHPYGRKNAPKAQEEGLSVPPIEKLNKAQNRALARGLAFRRADRIETVEELLDGLRVKKRNILTTVVLPLVAAAALTGVITPVVLDTIAERERESIIETLTSGQPTSIEDGLRLASALDTEEQRRLVLEDNRTRQALIDLIARGDESSINRGLSAIRLGGQGFTDDIKDAPAVQDAVVALYRAKVADAFNPRQDKLDFNLATEYVTTLKSIYPRAAGTFRTEQDLNNQRVEALASIEEQFNALIDSGNILPNDNAADIFNLRDRALTINPNSALATTTQVGIAAGELAQRAIEQNNYRQAQAFLTASLEYAPEQDDLGDLRYQVEEELQRQRNAALVKQIEGRLLANASTFTDLAVFQTARDDLIKLADLSPTSEVLKGLQEQLTSAFNTELATLIKRKKWPDAETLLVDFAKLLNLDFLESKRVQLTDAETKAGFAMEVDTNRATAIELRKNAIEQLVSEPDFTSDWEIALQVPFKEIIALLPASDAQLIPIREQIANLYISEAESARQSELTSRAKSLISRGATFYAGYDQFANQLKLIAETDAVIERKRAEAARVARVKRNLSVLSNKARSDDTQAAEAVLIQLSKDGRDTDQAAIAEGKVELGLAYGRLAQSPANSENWGAALKLIQRALELAPNNAELVSSERLYTSEYQKVVAVETLKEMLESDAPLKGTAVAKAIAQVKSDFPQQYGSKYEKTFEKIAIDRLMGMKVVSIKNLQRLASEYAILNKHLPAVTTAVDAELGRRLTAQTLTLENSDVNAAAQYLAAARKILPQSRDLSAIKLKLPNPLADKGRTLVAQGKLSEAELLLTKVTSETPQAPNLPPFRDEFVARKNVAERNFRNFEKYKRARRAKQGRPFLTKALEAWSDNPTYKSELAGLSSAPKSRNRYACDPKKAGLGSSNRATCFDTIAGERGPILVVVPAGGGNTKPYAIGKLEVTVSDYNRFCSKTGCGTVTGDGKLPVTNIGVAQARAYAKWLSQKTGATYRLPSVQEWEHAANAGGKQPRRDFNCTVTVSGQTLKGQSLVTALSGKPNGWGLINYVGNAREWVTSGGSLVARGGAFTDPMSECRISLQEPHNGNADPKTGFRLLRELG